MVSSFKLGKVLALLALVGFAGYGVLSAGDTKADGKKSCGSGCTDAGCKDKKTDGAADEKCGGKCDGDDCADEAAGKCDGDDAEGGCADVTAKLAELSWMEGEWNTEMTMNPNPQMPEGGKSTGLSTITKGLMGTAYIEVYRGKMGGVDFEGQSITSYEPRSGLWKSWWFDSMSPGGVSMNTGTYENGVLTLTGSSPCGDKETKMKMVMHKDSDTRMTYTMNVDMGKGWQEMFTIVYTKKA